MIARLRVADQETWYYDVAHAYSEDGYLRLRLEAYPHLVHYYFNERTSVLLCATAEDVTEALREELYHDMDKVRRI